MLYIILVLYTRYTRFTDGV